jgi:RNAse (barnase) inhibitor barstar
MRLSINIDDDIENIDINCIDFKFKIKLAFKTYDNCDILYQVMKRKIKLKYLTNNIDIFYNCIIINIDEIFDVNFKHFHIVYIMFDYYKILPKSIQRLNKIKFLFD